MHSRSMWRRRWTCLIGMASHSSAKTSTARYRASLRQRVGASSRPSEPAGADPPSNRHHHVSACAKTSLPTARIAPLSPSWSHSGPSLTMLLRTVWSRVLPAWLPVFLIRWRFDPCLAGAGQRATPQRSTWLSCQRMPGAKRCRLGQHASR